MKIKIIMALIIFISSPTFSNYRLFLDKENIVGNRIIGKWIINESLSQNLVGKDIGRVNGFIFEKELKVVKKIPVKYYNYLKDRNIYMAGIMTLSLTKGNRKLVRFPFILLGKSGCPYIIFFKKRHGNPMGDSESFYVMLAQGKVKGNDLLFVGGDFANEPFIAFERDQ